MAVTLADVWRVSAEGVWDLQQIRLSQHYIVSSVTGTVPDTTLSALLLAKLNGGMGGGDLFESKYLACMPPSYTLTRWVVQKIYPTRLKYESLARGAAGTHAFDTATGNQAAVITGQTPFAGRSEVSNKHIGPIPQDSSVQDSGMVAAAYKALLTTLAGAFNSSITSVAPAVQLDPGIYHRTGGIRFTSYYQMTVQDTLRVMRRRTVGVGI